MTSEEQFYNKVCRELFNKLFEKLDCLDRKLFHDENGVECLQSKINRVILWMQLRETVQEKKVTFWYWLIPLCLSIGILVVDKVWK